MKQSRKRQVLSDSRWDFVISIRNLVTAKFLKRFLHLWTQDFGLQNSPCFFARLKKSGQRFLGWSECKNGEWDWGQTKKNTVGSSSLATPTRFAPCKTDFKKKKPWMFGNVLRCWICSEFFLCCLNKAFSTSTADHGIAVNSHFRDLFVSYFSVLLRYLFS